MSKQTILFFASHVGMATALTKAEQLGLFAVPVQVSGSTDKHGNYRAPHIAMRRKKMPHPDQGELFSGVERHPVAPKLDKFLAKHGGPARMSETLKQQTPEVRAKLIDAMAHLDGLDPKAVMDRLGMGAASLQSSDGKLTKQSGEVSNPTDSARAEGDKWVMPLSEAVAEHRELVDTLKSPGKDDDKAQEKEQGAELERMEASQADATINSTQTDSGLIDAPSVTEGGHDADDIALAEDMVDLEEAKRVAPDAPETIALAENVGARRAKRQASEEAPKEGDTKTEDGVEYVLKDGRWHRVKENDSGLKQDIADDLDPASPNYRYRDTGYIAGSRKEEAAADIKRSAAAGRQTTFTAIDWDALEANPREARAVITKSNLFGKVDWSALKADGMSPAAGFLVDRVYAAIGSEPGEDTPRARQDYTLGLETLRSRLEKCKTPDDVGKALDDLRDEYDGAILTDEESSRYRQFNDIAGRLWAEMRAIESEGEALRKTVRDLENELGNLRYQQQKRLNRKWKPDPDVAARIAELGPMIAAAEKSWRDWDVAHPELKTQKVDLSGGRFTYENDIEQAIRKARGMASAVVAWAKARNKTDNPLHRAWGLMGDRFVAVLRYRGRSGSEAFAGHFAAAKAGKITDWSWAEKESGGGARSTKESARFQLKVADTYERIGGRPVVADSTATLKAVFNLRDVQSGNWVLRDVNAAKFHVEQTSAALSDLADLIGLPDEFVSLNGRLAMAFGARGKGAVGWADSAPRAHYEPIQRVVNLTKMGGGGCLGHEWFHALDNMIREVSGSGEAGAHDFVSESPALLLDQDMARAVDELVQAMTRGDHRRVEIIPYTASDYKTAKYNLENAAGNFQRSIRDAQSLEAALGHIDRYYATRSDRKSKSSHKRWRTLAAAWYGGNAAGGEASAKSGRSMSAFAFEAITLDEGKDGRYWSKTHEMAARAFQSWCEDRLADQGRRNDYLSVYADNKYHVDPLTGFAWKPYPEGSERARINAAFDHLFAVLRQKREMLKAMMALS